MTPQIERSPPAPDEARNAAAHPPEAPERVVELPLAELYPFKDHPFHVVDDAHTEDYINLMNLQKQFASGTITVDKFLNELNRMAQMIQMELGK